jgi:MFS family permease
MVSGLETLSRSRTFWALGAIIALYLAASAAPTPLYVVYQDEWGFSATTLTLIFAVYVFGLLGALLVFGRLSDHVGRRAVIAVAIALEVVAMLLFVVADGVAVLSSARVVQGVATGLAMTAMGAALVDLNPPENPRLAGIVSGMAPIGGLAIGALAAGALVEYGPWSTSLIYLLILAGLGAAAVVAWRMPETGSPRPGALASLRPRLGVPPRLRAEILALVPILVASWGLGGLYLSLGPSVAAQIFDLPNHVVGGLVVTLLCGTGALVIYRLRAWDLPRALMLSAGFLAAGLAVTLAGLVAETVVLAALGTVVAGVGFGASARGTFGTIASIALPEERGGLFAVFYVISYLAFSLPALAAGLASTEAGLRPTAIVYAAAALVLSLLAAWAQHHLASRQARIAPVRL